MLTFLCCCLLLVLYVATHCVPVKPGLPVLTPDADDVRDREPKGRR